MTRLPPDLEEAVQWCEALTRKTARHFDYSFRLLPADQARALRVIYAWCRMADDVVDGDSDWLWEDFSQATEKTLGGQAASEPVFQALAYVLDRYGGGPKPYQDMLQGMADDLVKKRYANLDESLLYCDRVASSVALMCLPVFNPEPGVRAEATARCIDWGRGMQWVNILRDVEEDLDRDRIYLPRDHLSQCDISEEHLFLRQQHQGFFEFTRQESERAQHFLEQGARLRFLLAEEVAACPLLMIQFYSAINQRIQKRGTFLGPRISLPTWQKIGMLLLA